MDNRTFPRPALLLTMLFPLLAAFGHLPAQLTRTDTISLHFPTNPLEDDLKSSGVLFLEDHLLLFPGDYNLYLFQASDTGYAFRFKVPLWDSKKDKVYMYGTNRWAIVEDVLIGAGYSSVFMYDLDAPEGYVAKKNLFPGSGLYISTSMINRLHTVRDNDGVRFYLPVWPRIRPNWKRRDKRPPRLTKDVSMREFVLRKKGGKWKLKRGRAFGTLARDQGVERAPYFWHWNFVSGAEAGLYTASNSSEWIRKYGPDGQALDSLRAAGAHMPDPFIARATGTDRNGIRNDYDSSGYYSVPRVMAGGNRILREYALPKGPDSLRTRYLQVIDMENKTVREFPLEKGRKVAALHHGRIVMVEDGNFAKGYLRLGLYRLD